MAMWKGGAGTPTPTLLSSRSRALSNPAVFQQNPAVFSALVVEQQVTGVEQKAAGYREDSAGGSSYTSLWGRVGRGWLGRPLACGLSLKYREFPFQELLQTSSLALLIFCVSLQHGCSGSNPQVSEGLCGSLLEWPAVLMNQTYCNVRQLPSQSFLL